MNEITVHAPTSGRNAYSVVPNPDEPVILQLDGNLTRIFEISAAGFTAAIDSVKPGRRYPFSLDLPTASGPISGYVDALPDTEDGEMVCRFVDLSVDQTDAMHSYVLERQKEVIRAIRSGNKFAAK